MKAPLARQILPRLAAIVLLLVLSVATPLRAMADSDSGGGDSGSGESDGGGENDGGGGGGESGDSGGESGGGGDGGGHGGGDDGDGHGSGHGSGGHGSDDNGGVGGTGLRGGADALAGSGERAETLYNGGWLERIAGGRYQLFDPRGRTVVDRPATARDRARFAD